MSYMFDNSLTYLAEITRVVAGLDPKVKEAADMLSLAKRAKRRVWAIGNGGSMAIAQHFAQDLLKTRGVRAHTLNDPSVITAYSNDVAFDYCHFSPLETLRDDGDCVVIFSCSGRSRNYIHFKSVGVRPLIAIVGTDGGFLKDSADICIHVKHENYAVCETAFCVISDLINFWIEGDRDGDDK